ncbi:MAG TPA: lysophospholipid acyltransferase family protein [Acidobacteriaceae bacterium]|nr:lysophospholipid acyltransferase family protein [Acidobacteriaceae bacterium]
MLRALVLLAVFLALGIPAAMVGIPWALVTGDISPVYGWAMGIVRTGLRAAGIHVEAEWQAKLDPAKKYLFFSNHASNLDPPVLLPLLPGRTSVFIKKSLMRIPVLGYGMKLAAFIPVSRDGTVESARESVEAAVGEMASGGVHITSFVEGTRSPDGRLLPFKKGPFYLAMESGAAVVPVTIVGTGRLMPKGSLKVRAGGAKVVFHAPIEPRDYASREDLMAAVRDAIESALPAERQ